ncbi:uncharacterized protein CLUP02_06090 [Colletotrichum lupini]|uniref:Uncharacterized protein n=1 Tax=Colletotrichum lupini TaxID=145971 RepID=A0A9Q8SNG5_9PEZI|nr:uncharacterized protein CLUP02_06090 [Colletotrichum lupini]UQC80607.1 hypothetical protein CLUP02_06090 [Colletotrichum lupini]
MSQHPIISQQRYPSTPRDPTSALQSDDSAQDDTKFYQSVIIDANPGRRKACDRSGMLPCRPVANAVANFACGRIFSPYDDDAAAKPDPLLRPAACRQLKLQRRFSLDGVATCKKKRPAAPQCVVPPAASARRVFRFVLARKHSIDPAAAAVALDTVFVPWNCGTRGGINGAWLLILAGLANADSGSVDGSQEYSTSFLSRMVNARSNRRNDRRCCWLNRERTSGVELWVFDDIIDYLELPGILGRIGLELLTADKNLMPWVQIQPSCRTCMMHVELPGWWPQIDGNNPRTKLTCWIDKVGKLGQRSRHVIRNRWSRSSRGAIIKEKSSQRKLPHLLSASAGALRLQGRKKVNLNPYSVHRPLSDFPLRMAKLHNLAQKESSSTSPQKPKATTETGLNENAETIMGFITPAACVPWCPPALSSRERRTMSAGSSIGCRVALHFVSVQSSRVPCLPHACSVRWRAGGKKAAQVGRYFPNIPFGRASPSEREERPHGTLASLASLAWKKAQAAGSLWPMNLASLHEERILCGDPNGLESKNSQGGTYHLICTKDRGLRELSALRLERFESSLSEATRQVRLAAHDYTFIITTSCPAQSIYLKGLAEYETSLAQVTITETNERYCTRLANSVVRCRLVIINTTKGKKKESKKDRLTYTSRPYTVLAIDRLLGNFFLLISRGAIQYKRRKFPRQPDLVRVSVPPLRALMGPLWLLAHWNHLDPCSVSCFFLVSLSLLSVTCGLPRLFTTSICCSSPDQGDPQLVVSPIQRLPLPPLCSPMLQFNDFASCTSSLLILQAASTSFIPPFHSMPQQMVQIVVRDGRTPALYRSRLHTRVLLVVLAVALGRHKYSVQMTLFPPHVPSGTSLVWSNANKLQGLPYNITCTAPYLSLADPTRPYCTRVHLPTTSWLLLFLHAQVPIQEIIHSHYLALLPSFSLPQSVPSLPFSLLLSPLPPFLLTVTCFLPHPHSTLSKRQRLQFYACPSQFRPRGFLILLLRPTSLSIPLSLSHLLSTVAGLALPRANSTPQSGFAHFSKPLIGCLPRQTDNLAFRRRPS